MTAEQKRAKRKFRHEMQAKVQLPINSRLSLTHAQINAMQRVVLDRYFAHVSKQKPQNPFVKTSAIR